MRMSTDAAAASVYDIYAQKRARQTISSSPDQVEKIHRQGKYTAEERLRLLFDNAAYQETDPWVRNSCMQFDLYKKEMGNEGVITAFGKLMGRKAIAFSHDVSVMGASLGEAQGIKTCRAIDTAIQTGVPIIGLNEASGARVQEGVAGLHGYCSVFGRTSLASGWVPQISVVLGTVAGGTAYATALTDFIIMVNPAARLFITGPAVIKAVTGAEVTFDQLGGSQVHGPVTGLAHFVVDSEREALELARRLCSFLPSNSKEKPPVYASNDLADRLTPGIRQVIPENPNRGFDMKEILREMLDQNDFLEVQEGFAKSMIVGFGRLDGRTVGVVANQPKVLAGCIDNNAAWKAARFVRFCDSYNIPILTFADCPGYMPGVEQEHGGIIRNGAKMLFAYGESTVPKITVVVRKDYGGAYSAMCGKGMGADVVLAFPTAELAVMGAESAASLIYRRELENAPDPQARRQDLIEAYKREFMNPYRAAEYGIVDDIIEPELLRRSLITHLELLENKEIWSPWKKHSNIPL